MATAVPTQPLTASIFLFGETQDSVEALADALNEQGVLGSLGGALTGLSRAGWQAAGGEVAAVAHGLLDLDLGGLIVAGWGKYADLTAAAKRTVAAPGSSEVVELATHRITSAHHPFIELLVDDVHVATVRFQLEVEFVVKGLVATVRNGHLVALHSGACEVTTTLAAEGRQLAQRNAHLPLPQVLRLRTDIPLLHSPERPPAASSLPAGTEG